MTKQCAEFNNHNSPTFTELSHFVMFSFEILSDPYFENHISYFYETWYKYKTLSDNVQRQNIPTLIVEPASGMIRYRDLGFQQFLHPSVNICDHPACCIDPTALAVAIIKPYMSSKHGPPLARHRMPSKKVQKARIVTLSPVVTELYPFLTFAMLSLFGAYL